ncbi:hypothetical protein LTR56_026020 [Elasticomyces elasticus]|nr:hypothetical protein LTR56_026020 [Elasticomyces elasticus]KAK3618585.1 hypothetical protein LTR22_026335 [Elasticomyces elasticus]KAK4903995.1 hypothetical protein LTR49_026470 [Elasticomyces elasticus]KAK5738403.1 hypothetical protein LTS12_025604 [Elasticomyces elasticus]
MVDLLSLPAELVESIATCTPPEDLPALRLTCKEVHSAVQRPFVKAHFREKTFMLPSSGSMQALVAISRHSIFGKAMKKVNLMALRVRDPKPARSDQVLLRVQRAEARGSPQLGALIRLIRHQRCLQQQISDEQDDYYSECQWTTPLIEALRNFKSTSCNMFVDWQECREYSGITRNAACGRMHIERMLGMGFLLHTFMIGGRDESVWDGLRTVDIAIDQYTRYEPTDHDVAQRMLDFMAGARLVEHLSLRCVADPADTRHDQFDAFTAMAQLPSIRHIWFGGALPDAGILVEFCQRHRDTLKQVVCTANLHEWTPRFSAARAALEQTAPWVSLLVKDVYRNMAIVNENDGYIHKPLVMDL